jgi:cytochrome P450
MLTNGNISSLPLPPTPRGPAFAHGIGFLLAEQWLIEQSMRRFGEVFSLKVQYPFERLVLVADPAEAKRIFTGDPAALHAGEGNAILEPLVGLNSVLLLDEARHLEQRKMLLPPFHGERMRVYGDLIVQITEEEVARWPAGVAFPLLPSFQRITLRVIIRAVFGIEDRDRVAELEPLLLNLLSRAERVLMSPPWLRREGLRWSAWSRFEEARDRVDAFVLAEIASRRAEPDPARVDVLSLMLEATDESGRPMSDRELRDELMTLLIAGHETTASQLAWLFERVLRHPDVLRRLQAEAEAGEHDFLDLAIKETQRTRPVLTMTLRNLTRDTQVGGYRVPSGWTLATSIWLIHNREDLFPDARSFRPERFENGKAADYSWLSFGGGVRRCLGAAFASYEMRIVAGTVLRCCSLLAADPRPERLRRRMITFVPGKGAQVIRDGELERR